MDPAHMALMIPLIGVSIPIVAIITKHYKDIAEIKARQASSMSSEVKDEIAALRREVAELRDTSTRFDMSFDAALTQLEGRVERIEGQQGLSHRPATRAAASEEEIPVAQVGIRR